MPKEKREIPEPSSLTAVSPLDGRYWEDVGFDLSRYFSDGALMRYRTKVEIEHLISLSDTTGVGMRALSPNEKQLLRHIYEGFTNEDGRRAKEIDTKIDHDVKAIEMFLREKLAGTSCEDILEWVHFGITSEDPSNLALNMMLRDCMKNLYIPDLVKVESKLLSLSALYRDVAMLGRTHGQPASPTTAGKEMAVFAYRLGREIEKLEKMVENLPGKLSGAVGTWSALSNAKPNVDWIAYSEKFVERLGLKFYVATPQILPHEDITELFGESGTIDRVLINFSQDMWRYISDGWFKLEVKKGEVGSSVMPHKVNPRHFETAEGNLQVADIFGKIGEVLQVTRLQRHLSDSTIKRNYGVPIGHSLLALRYLLKGLGRIEINTTAIDEALDKHPEVIAEAIQTAMRAEGIEDPYTRVKEATRGMKVTEEDLRAFIDEQPISQETKEQLKRLTPQRYVGLAPRVVDRVLEKFGRYWLPEDRKAVAEAKQ